MLGVDYAWGRPGVAALRAAGVRFVCRYLSPDSTGKNLDRAEADELSAAGFWLVVVYESTEDRSLAGHAAGASDAAAALAQATACGMPADRPIFFAVDFDAAGRTGEVLPYFAGAASVLGPARVGIYGGYAAVKAVLDAGHARWGWQTYAWSAGQWDSRAQLQQYSNDHVIGGVGLDFDRSETADFGQWRVGVSPAHNPPPQNHEEDDMPFGQLAEGPKAITPIALPKGKYRQVGFIADNGLQGLPAASLRVAVHHGPGWHIETVTVDADHGQAVLEFTDPATTDGISVLRQDDGAVRVAWCVE